MTISLNINQLMKKGGESTHIIYHRADNDGMCSGAIVRYYCEEKGISPNMIPMDYGDSFEPLNDIVEGDTIYIVDFSLPINIMEKFNKFNTLIWYDHHESAILEMKGLDIQGVRNQEMAACGICYDKLLKNTLVHENADKVTEIVDILSDYDNWNVEKHGEETYKNVHTALNRYLSTVKRQPNTDDGYLFWKTLLETSKINGYDLNNVLTQGRLILKFSDNVNANTMNYNSFVAIMPSEYTQGLGDLRCLCCNGVHGSQAFESKYNPNLHDMMFAFGYTNEKVYSISLYGTGSRYDLSKIAKGLGGGGHKEACGFSTETLIFNGDYIEF